MKFDDMRKASLLRTLETNPYVQRPGLAEDVAELVCQGLCRFGVNGYVLTETGRQLANG